MTATNNDGGGGAQPRPWVATDERALPGGDYQLDDEQARALEAAAMRVIQRGQPRPRPPAKRKKPPPKPKPALGVPQPRRVHRKKAARPEPEPAAAAAAAADSDSDSDGGDGGGDKKPIEMEIDERGSLSEKGMQRLATQANGRSVIDVRIDYGAAFSQQPLSVASQRPELALSAEAQQFALVHAQYFQLAAQDARIADERQQLQYNMLRATNDSVPLSSITRRAFLTTGDDYAAQDAVLTDERLQWLLSSSTQYTFKTFFDALRSPYQHERRCRRETDCYAMRVRHGDAQPQPLREFTSAAVDVQFATTRQWPATRGLCLFCLAIDAQSQVVNAMADEHPVRTDVAFSDLYAAVDVPGGFSRYDCIQSLPDAYSGAFAPLLAVCIAHYAGRWEHTPQGTVYRIYPVGLVRMDAPPPPSSTGDIDELTEAAVNFPNGPPSQNTDC